MALGEIDRPGTKREGRHPCEPSTVLLYNTDYTNHEGFDSGLAWPLTACPRCIGGALARVRGVGGVFCRLNRHAAGGGRNPALTKAPPTLDHALRPRLVSGAGPTERRGRRARHVPQVDSKRGCSAMNLKRNASTAGGSLSHSAGVRFET